MREEDVLRILGAILRKLDKESIEISGQEVAAINPDDISLYRLEDPSRFVLTRFKK